MGQKANPCLAHGTSSRAYSTSSAHASRLFDYPKTYGINAWSADTALVTSSAPSRLFFGTREFAGSTWLSKKL